MDPKEKALYLIVKLRALADDPAATEHEAQNARDKIASLQEKHGIISSERPTPPPTTPKQGDTHSDWFMDLVRQQYVRQRRAAEQREAREKAQRDWEARMANKDDNGQPKDPWTDTRTHAQRQADLNASFGRNDTWYSQTFNRPPMNDADWMASHQAKRCDPKLSFYDDGGIARRRNRTLEKCANCGSDLYIGEGAEFPLMVGNVVKVAYGCCDKVPGPRKKKSDETD